MQMRYDKLSSDVLWRFLFGEFSREIDEPHRSLDLINKNIYMTFVNDSYRLRKFSSRLEQIFDSVAFGPSTVSVLLTISFK